MSSFPLAHGVSRRIVNVHWSRNIHLKTGFAIFKADRSVTGNGLTGPFELLEIIEPDPRDKTPEELDAYNVFVNGRISFWCLSGAFGTPSNTGDEVGVAGGTQETDTNGNTVLFFPTFNDQTLCLTSAADPEHDPSIAVQFIGTFLFYKEFVFGNPPGDVYVAGYYLPGESP